MLSSLYYSPAVFILSIFFGKESLIFSQIFVVTFHKENEADPSFDVEVFDLSE